jgi:hypothetical protein
LLNSLQFSRLGEENAINLEECESNTGLCFVPAWYVLWENDAVQYNDLQNLDAQIVATLSADLDDNSHMIFYRFVEEDKYETYQVKFASKYVEDRVFQAIDTKQR